MASSVEDDCPSPSKRVCMLNLNPYVKLDRTFVVNTVPVISSLMNDVTSSDVTVRVNRCTFYLHKLILTQTSQVFARWLSDTWQKTGEPLVLHEKNEEFMEAFFKFFYTGRILLDSSNLVEFYALADKYMVTGLLDECSRLILDGCKVETGRSLAFKDITIADPCTTLSIPTIIEITHFLNPKLASAAMLNLKVRLATEVFEGIFKTFSELPYDILVDVLEDIPCKSEMKLFLGLVRWIDMNQSTPQSSPSHSLLETHSPTPDVPSGSTASGEMEGQLTKKRIALLLSHIRFPIMTPQDLYQCEQVAKQHQFADSHFYSLISTAYRYFSLTSSRVVESEDSQWHSVTFKKRSLSTVKNMDGK